MRRLLLDIRNNPGGPLDQAIKVVNEFMPRGKMIVYTRGPRGQLGQDYRATEDSEFTDIPIVLDREPRQRERVGDRHRRAAGSRPRLHRRRDDVRQGARPVDLPHQRRRRPRADDRALLHAERAADPASVGRDVRRVLSVPSEGSGREQAAQRERSRSSTDAGRPVYSGGGIEPDKRVDGPIEGFNPTRFGRSLYARAEFANYAQKFTRRRRHARHAGATGRKTSNRTSSSTTRWWPTSASS